MFLPVSIGPLGRWAAHDWPAIRAWRLAALAACDEETVEARGQVLTGDEAISLVYVGEAAGVTNAALSQLVKRLRGALNPHAQRLMNDPTYTCVETIRGVGYKLNE